MKTPLGGLTAHSTDDPFRSADFSEDRADKAFAAIEGSPDGFFTNNPWEPIRDFGAALNGAIDANGGLVLDVSISDPWSAGDSCRIAFLWDDETVAFGPLVVDQGTRFPVTIPNVKGINLSAWCTDEVALTVHDKRPLRELADVTRRIEERGERDDAEPGMFERIVDKYLKTVSVVGAVAVVAVAIGAYVYVKGK